jgi:hypothetical protein
MIGPWARAIALAARVNGLAAQTNALPARVNAPSGRTNAPAARLIRLAARSNALAARLIRLAARSNALPARSIVPACVAWPVNVDLGCLAVRGGFIELAGAIPLRRVFRHRAQLKLIPTLVQASWLYTCAIAQI